MAKSTKLMTCLMTLIFSHSASAVIVEGSFTGQTTEFYSSNMDATSDADFWNLASWGAIKGTFWYDTEVASQALIESQADSISATYSGPHNWLHTTWTIGDKNLDITSSGNSGTFSQNPYEKIVVEKYDDGVDYYDRIAARYEDVSGTSYRTGYLTLESEIPVLNGLDLAQSFPVLPGPDIYDNIVGYIGFETSGIANGVDYHGWMVGELNVAEIRVRDTVSVPEPSSLFLLFGPLLFLAWRAGSLPHVSEKYTA